MDLYTVPIEGPLQSVAIRLVKMGLVARRTQEPVAQWTITSPLPLPQHLEVVVSCCNDPSNFYIQLVRIGIRCIITGVNKYVFGIYVFIHAHSLHWLRIISMSVVVYYLAVLYRSVLLCG